MLRLILVIFVFNVFLAFASCRSSQQSENSSVVLANKPFPAQLSSSSRFRFFWDELQRSLASIQIDRFEPSKIFIDRFHLQNSAGKYFFSGFLHVDETFNPDEINALGGALVQYSDNIYSFRLPIKQTFKLVSVKGIKRIEIETEVFVK